ncbi:MAG: zinc ABC transporter substrate-binding protein [Lachnospiraceae bacterium]|nr:zinc ABC transporter substrate-binding protein [Lachnospiraceae bacterium]
MKRKKYLFVFCMLLAITVAGTIFTKIYLNLEEGEKDSEKTHIVTSFYPVYIGAKNIAGDSSWVTLENLSEPQTGCMHDYQLTPQDMILLSKADLFLVNGGGIEGFLADVGESYPDLAIKKATEGLELSEALSEEKVHEEIHGEKDHEELAGEEEHVHGAENAHGWMDTRIYRKMIENMAGFMGEADPEHQSFYEEQAQEYCGKVQKLTEQLTKIREEWRTREPEKKNVVIFHEAYAYLAEEAGLNVVYCLNLDEERQVSAREVADVMEEIENHQVSAILAEELYGKEMGEMIEKETDCKVYYLDTLVRGDYDNDSYLTGMQKNIEILQKILEEEDEKGKD